MVNRLNNAGLRDTTYSKKILIVLAGLLAYALASSIWLFGVPNSILNMVAQEQETRNLHASFLQKIKEPMGFSSKGTSVDPIYSLEGKIRSNHTIITAYFLVNRTKRHSDNEYLELMGRLFSSSESMIIFTSPELAPTLAKIRGKPERTVVIPMKLKDTNLAKTYSPDFWKSVSRDGKGHGINYGLDYDLYQIWNSKVDFLKMGSDLNPFRSNFFAWIDAGFVRWDQYTNSTIIQRIPPELPENKFAIMNVTPVLFHKNHHQMSANCFAGYKKAVDLYHARYYEILHKYAQSTDRYTYLSNEQIILHDTCTDNDGSCFVVTPRKSKNNPLTPCLTHPYFYLLPFFHEKEYSELVRMRLVDKSGW